MTQGMLEGAAARARFDALFPGDRFIHNSYCYCRSIAGYREAFRNLRIDFPP